MNGVLVENAEDLDIVMPMYNLPEYSNNYSKTSGSLWNYYKDELTDETNDDNGPNKNVINSKSFKYKTSITGSTYNVVANTGDYVCYDSPTNAVFKITDCKLYVPVVTLSAENDDKLLEQLKTGFKKTIKWNKYRSEMSSQIKIAI